MQVIELYATDRRLFAEAVEKRSVTAASDSCRLGTRQWSVHVPLPVAVRARSMPARPCF
jgi:hypothetical protein